MRLLELASMIHLRRDGEVDAITLMSQLPMWAVTNITARARSNEWAGTFPGDKLILSEAGQKYLDSLSVILGQDL